MSPSFPLQFFSYLTIDDDEDGLPEEQDGMSEEELASLEESVKPI